MKILFVSMASPHFFRWVTQLDDGDHELYWLDVYDSGSENGLFNRSIINWRYRWNYPGRQYIKGKFPRVNTFLNRWNERNLHDIFKMEIEAIKPDVVHSFVMFAGVLPISDVMFENPNINWIYSSWGSDLFARDRLMKDPGSIDKTLKRVNFLFTDCKRDFKIAQSLGFKGKFLGVFPGGGGIDFKKWDEFIHPWKSRNLILIKGYQSEFGRCISVLKALVHIKKNLSNYQILVFGADKEVFDYIKENGLHKWENLRCLGKVPHKQVMQLLGETKIYIGNSSSDGMPNTLLEAICMGAFPVQSNPGGATSEVIIDGVNGRLIQNSEDVEEIKDIIEALLENEGLEEGVSLNLMNIKPKLERELIKKEILNRYSVVRETVNHEKIDKYF